MAILRNSVAAPPKVSVLAAGLLASVYAHSRHMLKTEMGVMIPAVVLAPIEAVAGIDASRTKGEPQQAAAMPAAPAASAQTNGGGGHSAGGSAARAPRLLLYPPPLAPRRLWWTLHQLRHGGVCGSGALRALRPWCVRNCLGGDSGSANDGAQRACTAACALAERLGEWA